MDERAEVEEAVRRKQARAEELGIPAAAIEFYDDAQHYPHWQETSPRHVPPGVLNARFCGDDPTGADFFNLSVEFEYQGRAYRLSRVEGEPLRTFDGLVATAVLSLEVDGVAVLELSLQEAVEQDATWSASSIDRFIEGPWTEAFRRLCAEVSAHAKQVSADILAELGGPPASIEERRSRFGIADADLRETAAPVSVPNGTDDQSAGPNSLRLAARALHQALIRMTRAVLR